MIGIAGPTLDSIEILDLRPLKSKVSSIKNAGTAAGCSRRRKLAHSLLARCPLSLCHGRRSARRE